MAAIAYSGMAEAIQNRRRPVSKPLYLRADSPILAAAIKVTQARNERSLADTRRTVSQYHLSSSPASRTSGSPSLFDLAHSPATSSSSSLSSPPLSTPRSSSCSVNDHTQRSKSASFLFPMPPAASLSTDAQLGLNATGFGAGLGLDNFMSLPFERQFESSPIMHGSDPVNPRAPSPLERTQSQMSGETDYESDGLTGSQGWSPSTAGDRSVCTSPVMDQSMSFTRPLSIRKASASVAPVSLANYAESDEAKLEHLHSSFSLLAMDELHHSPQEAEDDAELEGDHDADSPMSPEDLRYMYSPEHGAPSLEEQLAYACGQGYMRDGGSDASHHDSASGYLQWLQLSEQSAQSADGHSPSGLSSMDPFVGMRAELGSSWSDAHAALSRGNSLRGTPALRSLPVKMHSLPTPAARTPDMVARSPEPPVSDISVARSTSSLGRESPLARIAKTKSQLDLTQLFQAATKQAVADSPEDNTKSSSQEKSPAAENLAEFSFMTMMDDTVEEEDFDDSSYKVVLPEPRIRLLSPEVFTCPLGSPDLEQDASFTSIATLPPMDNLSSPAAKGRMSSDAMQASLYFNSFPSANASRPSGGMSISQSMPVLGANTESSTILNSGKEMLPSIEAASSLLDRARPVRRGSKYQRQVAMATIKTRKRAISAASESSKEKVLPALPAAQEVSEEAAEEADVSMKAVVSRREAEVTPAEALKNAWRRKRDSYASDTSKSIPVSLVPAHDAAMGRSVSASQLEEHALLKTSPTRLTFAAPPSATKASPGMPTASQSCSDLPYLAGDSRRTSLSREASLALKEAKAQSMQFKAAQSRSVPPSKSHVPVSAMKPSTSSHSMGNTGNAAKSVKNFRISAGPAAGPRAAAAVKSKPPTGSQGMSKSMSMPSQMTYDSSNYPLPTLLVARTKSQRRRGETGIPETHPRLLEAIREQECEEMSVCDGKSLSSSSSSGRSSNSNSSNSAKSSNTSTSNVETRFVKARWSSVKSLVLTNSSKKSRQSAALAARSEVRSRSSMETSRSSLSLQQNDLNLEGLLPFAEEVGGDEEGGILVLEEKTVVEEVAY